MVQLSGSVLAGYLFSDVINRQNEVVMKLRDNVTRPKSAKFKTTIEDNEHWRVELSQIPAKKKRSLAQALDRNPYLTVYR